MTTGSNLTLCCCILFALCQFKGNKPGKSNITCLGLFFSNPNWDCHLWLSLEMVNTQVRKSKACVRARVITVAIPIRATGKQLCCTQENTESSDAPGSVAVFNSKDGAVFHSTFAFIDGVEYKWQSSTSSDLGETTSSVRWKERAKRYINNRIIWYHLIDSRPWSD